MSELSVIDEAGIPVPVASAMPMRLVEMAVQKGTDIDQLAKLRDNGMNDSIQCDRLATLVLDGLKRSVEQ